jgi:hypothetical protein
VDAPGQVTELDDDLLRFGVRHFHKRPNLIQVEFLLWERKFFLGQPEPHGKCHQLRLGPVMEITFDPPQGGHRIVNGDGAGVLKRTKARSRGIWRQECAHQESIDEDGKPHSPRRHEKQDEAKEQGRDP